MDNLYIIIPAYNEDMNIEQVARDWHEVLTRCGGKDSRLVIIDDGSKDNTCQVLCNLQKELPLLEPLRKDNSGHGATILYGYNYALERKADFIFQTDADGQTLSSEFYKFWEIRRQYSAIIGYRNQRQDGWSRIMVSKVLKYVLYFIFRLKIKDANTPYRLIKHDVLGRYMKYIPANFNLSNVMLSYLLIAGKEKVMFMPITFKPRQGGVNSINLVKISKIGIQAIKDFWEIRRALHRREGSFEVYGKTDTDVSKKIL